MADVTQRKEDRPDTRSDVSADMLVDVTVCRDVAKGTRHMREQTVAYLPKHPKEERADYERRLGLAILFNAFQRTTTGLAGMVFDEDVQLSEDVPPAIVAMVENIDNAGTHLDVFAKRLFEDGLEAGHAGILVDVPRVELPEGRDKLSDAEEKKLGVRPYWVHVPKEHIVSFRTTVENGRTLLSQLVLYEPAMVEDGLFGEKVAKRYRVLKRAPEGIVTTELWEVDDRDVASLVDGPFTVTNQSEIPFAPYYANATGVLRSRPPLLDLAYTNIAHYQHLADHRYALHIANVPVPVIIGVDANASLSIGPNAGLRLPVGADAKYLEPSGNAFQANLSQLTEFKSDMAAMGLSMLQRESRAAETAEAKRIDKGVEESALATAARSLQDAIEAALGFTAKFMKLPDGGSVTVKRDFDDLALSPDEMRVYLDMVTAGNLSIETMWALLERGGKLPDGFDPDMERERIEATYDPPEPVALVVPAEGDPGELEAAA